jgi:hypothetical protein
LFVIFTFGGSVVSDNEITQEELENMSEAEFLEAIGKGPIKAGHIRTEGLNLTPQRMREKAREMARKGELLGFVGPKQKVHRNKFGLGYSTDPEDVEGESTLLQRQKRK